MYNRDLPSRMEWVECSCGHVFTSGYWSSEAIDLINKTTFNCQSVATDMALQRIISASMVESVTAIMGLPSGQSWLDVGFGNGSLLFTASEYGFKGTGLEIRKPLVDGMKRIGIEAYCSTIEDMPQQHFDVISMCDVLEHCTWPDRALIAASNRLPRDGLLLVSMPNMGSPVWDYLTSRNENPYWDEIEHYHNFSRERLYSLLNDCGFRPLSYRASRRYAACMEIIARVV